MEDKFVQGGVTRAPATAGQAQDRINALFSDPDWQRRFNAGSKTEVDEWRRLTEQVTGVVAADEYARLGRIG